MYRTLEPILFYAPPERKKRRGLRGASGRWVRFTRLDEKQRFYIYPNILLMHERSRSLVQL